MTADPKTLSEALFEQFLSDHGLPFERVPVTDSPRPDYAVGDGAPWGPLMFEVKELREDDDFSREHFGVSSRKVGAHIRSKISESKRQVQYGAKQGVPSILLIYNVMDPSFHLFGTDDHDFTYAMHGDWAVVISRETHQILDAGHGRNRSFSADKNTSFTALGHLAPRYGVMTVRLFANKHAKVPLPLGLPPCFDIV